jgi:o-succinylbenzoate---CoA ligase
MKSLPWIASSFSLAGLSTSELEGWINEYRERLSHAPVLRPGPRRVLIAEPDPRRFVAALLAAQAEGADAFLGDPRWSPSEQAQALALVQPELALGPWTGSAGGGAAEPTERPAAPMILVPTGGTTGQLRFAAHTAATLTAASDAVARFFGQELRYAVCVLPLFHVSGLLQLIRCARAGGTFWLGSDRDLWDPAFRPEIPDTGAFISLVPTQLNRLLERPDATDWLRRFQAILLGGAAAWPGLLDRARELRLPLAPTYGMTETAAQIATMLPSRFLAGETVAGDPLPQVDLKVRASSGLDAAAIGEVGEIEVSGSSLFHGYWPQLSPRPCSRFATGDLGRMDELGLLQVLGRASEVINTGGEKVYPLEVEAAIRSAGLAEEVAVFGAPDPEWGQVVCAALENSGPLDSSAMRERLRPLLASYKIPRRWLTVQKLPRNRQGKLARAQLLSLL